MARPRPVPPPEAPRLLAALCGVGPVETLEDPVQALGRDARSRVRDAGLDAFVCGTALHRYRSAGGREAEGVVEEGGEDLARAPGVAARGELARVVDLQVLALGAGGESLRGLGEDEGEVEGFAGDGDPVGVQAR